jgi:hypothetical protein
LRVKRLQNERDYKAAVGHLETLSEEAEEDEVDEDLEDAESPEEEIELLETLIDDYEARHQYQEYIDDYEIMPRFPEAQTLSLATFKLSNGNEVRMIGIPSLQEIMIGEISDAGVEDFILDPEMRPVEIFKRLAPEDSPVPRMLVLSDTSNVLEGRKPVDTIKSSIEVSLDSLGIQQSPQAAGVNSCTPGPAGAQFFKDHHCGALGGPGYGKSDSYCYPDGYKWIQKTSSARRRTTYARMASCGTGTNRMRHFYRTISGYHTQLTVDVSPNKVARYWSAEKGTRRYRRVRFESLTEGGWVRGWVIFHNQIAGGWF